MLRAMNAPDWRHCCRNCSAPSASYAVSTQRLKHSHRFALHDSPGQDNTGNHCSTPIRILKKS
jgi:hypothetical protein